MVSMISCTLIVLQLGCAISAPLINNEISTNTGNSGSCVANNNIPVASTTFNGDGNTVAPIGRVIFFENINFQGEREEYQLPNTWENLPHNFNDTISSYKLFNATCIHLCTSWKGHCGEPNSNNAKTFTEESVAIIEDPFHDKVKAYRAC